MSPQDTDEENEYSVVREDVLTTLDPELQDRILNTRKELALEAGAATNTQDEAVDVIVRLKSPNDEVPAEVEVSQRMGDVVTGRVKIKDIVPLRQQESVVSLKSSRKLYQTLDSSVPEIRASIPQLRADFPGRIFDGAGVIVGVIDHGCDFAHPNFMNANRTRIKYLWDQNESSDVHPPPYGFQDGREFNAQDIDAALKFERPQCYDELGYRPESTHGTRVLDIAAGNGTETTPQGVAPQADIIFVDVKHDDVDFIEPLSASRLLLDAVKYIFKKADQIAEEEGVTRPVVINISLSADGGPHDGSTPFERGIDYLLRKPGRAVVMAAGNSAGQEDGQKRHVGGLLQAGQKTLLGWYISNGQTNASKAEIWYSGLHEIQLSLIPPGGGNPIFPSELGYTSTIRRSDAKVARVFHRKCDPNNHDNQILIIFDETIEPGTWTIVLESVSSSPFVFHAWAENNGPTGAGFLQLSVDDDSYTIGSIACGFSTIAVGAYFTAAPNAILSTSAEGPTRDGRQKPEVSAPGANCPPGRGGGGGIRAAASLGITSTRGNGGTSAAAPHVTGLIALLMQAAAPELLSGQRIREIVIENARPISDHCAWHPRFGMGRVDAIQSLEAQANLFNAAPASVDLPIPTGIPPNILPCIPAPAPAAETQATDVADSVLGVSS